MGKVKSMVDQQNKTLGQMPDWQRVQFEQFGYPTDFGKTPVGVVATEAGKIAAEIAKENPQLVIDQAKVAAEKVVSPEKVEQTVQALAQSGPDFAQGYQEGYRN